MRINYQDRALKPLKEVPVADVIHHAQVGFCIVRSTRILLNLLDGATRELTQDTEVRHFPKAELHLNEDL